MRYENTILILCEAFTNQGCDLNGDSSSNVAPTASVAQYRESRKDVKPSKEVSVKTKMKLEIAMG